VAEEHQVVVGQGAEAALGGGEQRQLDGAALDPPSAALALGVLDQLDLGLAGCRASR
jgi:hypothetical protein